MIWRHGLVFLSVGVLAGCGGSGGGGLVADPVEVDTALFNAEASNINDDLTLTAAFPNSLSLPATGSATYAGQFGMVLSGETDATLIGDMDMRANFASRDITGQVTDFVALDSFGAYEPGGSLDIDGSFTGSTINADATGRLAIFDSRGGGGNIAQVDFDLDMTGSFRDPPGPEEETIVRGVVSGTGSGDLNLGVTGEFIAEDTATPFPLLNP